MIETELTSEGLADDLRRAVAGEVPMPAAVAHQLIIGASARRPSGGRALTAREEEVVALLVEGLSNKQIARRLDLSLHGVKHHVANVLGKFDCPNRALVVARATTGWPR